MACLRASPTSALHPVSRPQCPPSTVCARVCSRQPHRTCRMVTVRASPADGAGTGGDEDYQAAAARLNALFASKQMDARELRGLVFEKWGRSYDVRLHRRANRMYLQVMWKFLEQQSFHLTEQEYMDQLDAVASYINDWGVAETVRNGIRTARQRGPGLTGGNGARCISIPLDVDLSASRKGEWN